MFFRRVGGKKAVKKFKSKQRAVTQKNVWRKVQGFLSKAVLGEIFIRVLYLILEVYSFEGLMPGGMA